MNPLVKVLITDATGTEAILNTKSTGYADNKGIIVSNENWVTYTIDLSGYTYLRYSGHLSNDASICFFDSSGSITDSIQAGENKIIEEIVIEIPAGSTQMKVSCKVNKYCAVMLFTQAPDDCDVTHYIMNITDIETVNERDDTSGVIDSVSFPIEIALDGADYLRNAFQKYGLYASYKISVYKRGNYNQDYTLQKSTHLDFSTYKEYEEKVTIEYAEEELTELINSEGKTKYEIPVDEICESKKWIYNRMNFINNASYEIPYNIELKIPDVAYFYFTLPATLNDSEQIPGDQNDIKGEELSYNSDDSWNFVDYFFKSYAKKTIDINVSINLSIECSGRFAEVFWGDKSFTYNDILGIAIYKFKADKTYEVVKRWEMLMKSYSADGAGHWRGEYMGTANGNLKITVNEGERLSLVITMLNNGMGAAIENGKFTVTQFGGFSLHYIGASKEIKKIDVIDPGRLIQKYVDMMSGRPGLFTAKIEWEENDYQTKIIAAESIRQLPGAKLYSSPNDFFEWMRILGYEYKCSDKNLTFKIRDNFFRKNLTAMSLSENEVAGLVIQADNTYAYTSIEIGYDKQDYDSINGRCEANGTFAYTTGYITRDDNKLKFISPYRADSMGIEKLCQESDKKTTDSESDNDVFFVAVTEKSDAYNEYKGITIKDKNYAVELFNAPFNPYFLVQRNESLIGINARQVKFKSTDMSRTAEITGVEDIYADQEISKQLFLPVEYNFATGNWKDLPPDNLRDGLIYFEWHGKTLKGFIKQVRKNYIAETESTWELWAVE